METTLRKNLKYKISLIFGTRPEAIKLAPVIIALRLHPQVECRVCVTAQHRDMLDQVLEVFSIVPDVDLNLMEQNQTLANFTARAITAIDKYLADDKPELVLVQGDTTTVLAASLASFYRHIPVGHVEAGLRTGNLQAPWPEEANRVLTSRLARLHFAPTPRSRDNLLAENVPPSSVHLTGNTVVDALMIAREKTKQLPLEMLNIPPDVANLGQTTRIVLITGHRRESFGGGMENICTAIAELAQEFRHVHFVYPVHMNPRVREPVFRVLGSNSLPNVHLLKPLTYLPFVALMDRAYLILTDSGGIQEEAPSLGKPVLVMRETTERPEGIECGVVRLVGSQKDNIVTETRRLLLDEKAYSTMASSQNPYGDGNAAARIVSACIAYFSNGNISDVSK